MTRIGVPGYMDDSASNVAQFSPDQTRFALVLKKGNLAHDTNEYTLTFRTRDALSSAKAEATLKMESASNREAIKTVRWLSDNRRLLFIGESPAAMPQIYSFDVMTRRLKQITHHANPIVAFDASADGKVIVFEADPPVKDIMDTPEVRRAGFYATGEDLGEILLAGTPSSRSWSRDSRELFVLTSGRLPQKIATPDGIWPNLTLSVAPNGRYALIEALVRDVPKEWLGYGDRVLHEFIAANKAPTATSLVERYLMLDTNSKTIAPLIDAPKSWEHDGFVWVDGGRSIILSKAYLPLASISVEEGNERANNRYVVEVNPATHSISKITSDSLVAKRWMAKSKEIVLEAKDASGATGTKAYRRKGASWDETASVSNITESNRPAVTYEQDMNTAPKIWVAAQPEAEKKLLLDLNPQFSRLCFAKEEQITWQGTDGHPLRGGLYLPPDYQPNHRYPLVIQTHAFDPHKFWIDGPWSSAFAAQPLAARGIVVLQVGGAADGRDSLYRSTPSEAPRQMAAFEGAIDYLDRRGIIDRERVGIIGFSRTVFHVAYTLTHSKYHFAAATLADGFNAGYFEEIAFRNVTSEHNVVNGGPPYGASLPSWLERAPAFRIAALHSPVRLESYGMASTIEQWEWFSLLSQQKKPVDFLLLPRGTHILVKPSERLASQQGNVDWFTFWLNGEIDGAPKKREIYARWKELRNDQRAQ